MKYVKLIEELSNARGTSGFEDEVITVVNNNKGAFTLQVDQLKNGYLNLNKLDAAKSTVMIDSHLDEVGFMTQSIEDNGLIRIQALGGWIASNVSAQQFLVRNSEGNYINGIIATKPVHFMTAAEKAKNIEMADLKLDIGATSRAEVINDFKITIGQPIVPATKFSINAINGTMLGKAFDNRIGAAVALAVFNELGAEEVANLPFNLVGTFAAQEEVGLRGAKVATSRVNPTMAIVLEATPSDDFTAGKTIEQGKLGHGPQIRHRDNSYIANEKLVKDFHLVAAENNISVQSAVRDGGGTNAGSIHLANLGVPVATIGVPNRYAHTNATFSSYYDFQAAVNLVLAYIRQLTADDLASFGFQTL